MCLRSPARTTTQRSSFSAPMRCPTVESRAAAMLASVAMGDETLPFSTLLRRLRERLALTATSPRLRPWAWRSRRMRRPMRDSTEVFPVFLGMKPRWILGEDPGTVKQPDESVVSQFETVATQSPPIHRAGGAGGALGNPIGLSGPPSAGRLLVRLSRRTTTGFPRPHPPRPPSPRCSRSDRRLEWRGAHARPEEIACPQPSYDRLECGRDRRSIPRASFAARLRGPSDAWRGERRVGLRKPVVVRRDRRTAYRHSGGRLDGPIGFPKAHPSLPPGERAVRVRTETLPMKEAHLRCSSGSSSASRASPGPPPTRSSTRSIPCRRWPASSEYAMSAATRMLFAHGCDVSREKIGERPERAVLRAAAQAARGP